MMMARPPVPEESNHPDKLTQKQIDEDEEPLSKYPFFDQIKAQPAYVHPALVQKQPLQRRATAPTRRPMPATQLAHAINNIPPQAPVQQPHPESKPRMERPATIHYRYKRKIGPYTLTKTLGAGSMGKVKLGIHETTGHKVAVKIIPRKTKKPTEDTTGKDEDAALTDMAHEDKRVMREVAILFLLHHPFIVKMVDFMVTPHHYYLMFENVEGGQLLDYIIAHGKLNERTARKFARQILSSLDYCHKNSVVHRDLKIENILISNTGSIKIIDFGLSNLYSTKSTLSTFCGSLYFAAPELLSAKPYTGPEVDIWSFGIVLFVLMCGEVPFDDKSMTMIHHKIKRGVVKYPAWLSPDCRHLLSRLLVTNPLERATMVEIMQHPWINKGFHGPPDSYFPNRPMPSLPVDPEIVKRMTGFQFGTPEQISEEVAKAISEYSAKAAERSNSPRLMGFDEKQVKAPLSYPYLSIYSLAKEKLDRESNRTAQDIVVRDEDKIAEETPKEVSSTQLMSTPDSNLSRSKSCRPNINGVSGRYPSIPSRPQNREHATHVPTSRPTELQVQAITRRNSDRRSSQGAAPSPLTLDVVKETPASFTHRTSIKFSDNAPNRRASAKAVSAKPEHLTLPENENQSSAPHIANPRTPRRKPSRLEKFGNFLTRATSMRETKERRGANREANSNQDPGTPQPQGDQLITSTIHHVSLKGLFSVSTTSSKKPQAIRAELIRVLKEMNVAWRESDGYISVALTSRNLIESGVTSAATSPQQRPSKPVMSGSDNSSNEDSGYYREYDPSALDLNERRASPNVGDGEGASRPALRFEIQIVKVSLIKLYGMKFRRLVGHPWEYKEMCSHILSRMKL